MQQQHSEFGPGASTAQLDAKKNRKRRRRRPTHHADTFFLLAVEGSRCTVYNKGLIIFPGCAGGLFTANFRLGSSSDRLSSSSLGTHPSSSSSPSFLWCWLLLLLENCTRRLPFFATGGRLPVNDSLGGVCLSRLVIIGSSSRDGPTFFFPAADLKGPRTKNSEVLCMAVGDSRKQSG